MTVISNLRDRVRDFRRVRGVDLQDNAGNWREHPQAQRRTLAAILKEIGIAGALTAYESERQGGLTLIDGHLRAEDQPEAEWPTLILDVDDEEADALLAALDPLAAMAQANQAKLEQLKANLANASEELKAALEQAAAAVGVSPPPPSLPDAPEPQLDKAEQLRDKWQTATGQLWQLGEHRLICGDCTDRAVVERVMGGERAQACVTDPPYSSGGFTRSDRILPTDKKYIQSGTKVKRPNFSGDNRDQRSWVSWCERWLSLYLSYCDEGSPLAIWTDWRQLPALTDAIQGGGWVWRGIAVWDKTEAARPLYGRFRPQAEYLVWGSLGPYPVNDGRPAYPGVFCKVVDANKLHQTQKPVEVVQWSLSMTIEGGIVIDPFLGSGTTLIAAHQLGRRCRAIEIDPRYVAVALQRWVDLTGQQPQLIIDNG